MIVHPSIEVTKILNTSYPHRMFEPTMLILEELVRNYGKQVSEDVFKSMAKTYLLRWDKMIWQVPNGIIGMRIMDGRIIKSMIDGVIKFQDQKDDSEQGAYIDLVDNEVFVSRGADKLESLGEARLVDGIAYVNNVASAVLPTDLILDQQLAELPVIEKIVAATIVGLPNFRVPEAVY